MSSGPRWRPVGVGGQTGPVEREEISGGDRGRRATPRGGTTDIDGGGSGGRVDVVTGKDELGLNGPVPTRVTGAVKIRLLELIEAASDAGWSVTRACSVLGLDRQRAWRWDRRRTLGGSLDDQAPGGNPTHGLLEWEITEILALFDEFADIDFSHRKLAHRGSYENRVWVSPSTGTGFWPVTALSWQETPGLAGPTRHPGPSGVNGHPTSSGVGTPHNSKPAPRRTTRTESSILSRGNGSPRPSPRNRHRSRRGCCSPKPSTPKDSSPTTSPNDYQISMRSYPVTTRVCLCCWPSAWTDFADTAVPGVGLLPANMRGLAPPQAQASAISRACVL